MSGIFLSLVLMVLTFLPLASLEAFEWRCCFPRGKFFGCDVVDCIEAKGILQLQGTKVPRGLYLEGTLEAECARIGRAKIKGRSVLTKSIVDGDISICGRGIFHSSIIGGVTEIGGVLEASHTNFCDQIQAASGFIELKKCTVPALYIFACGEDLQIVKLLRGTVVQGDIVFESGKGRVMIDRSSTLCGKIHGGLISYPGDW